MQAQREAHCVGDGMDAAIPSVDLSRCLVFDRLPFFLDEIVPHDLPQELVAKLDEAFVAARIE